MTDTELNTNRKLRTEVERLRQRVEELETRLEVAPDHPWDGIACRDATIKMLEAKLAELRKAQGEQPVFIWLNPYTLELSDHPRENFGPLYTSAPSVPDCNTCANRGEVDGLSQESHCEHCIYGAKYRTNHYAPKPEDKK